MNTLGFEEDMDPYQALGVGQHAPFKGGDKIRIIKDIWWGQDYHDWFTVDEYENALEQREDDFIMPDSIYIYDAKEEWFLSDDLEEIAISSHWLDEHPDYYKRVLTESLKFEEDLDLYKALKVGRYRDIKIGDIIKIIHNSESYSASRVLEPEYNKYPLAGFFILIVQKNNISDDKLEYLAYNEDDDLQSPHQIWEISKAWFENPDNKWEFDYKVNESLNFEEDLDLYKALKIGSNNYFRDYDRIVLTHSVWWFDNDNYNGNWYDTNNIKTLPQTDSLIFEKGTILHYNSEDEEFLNDNNEFIPYNWLKHNKHVWRRYINESLDFQEDMDSYKAIDVGPNRSSTWPRLFKDLDEQQKNDAIEGIRNVRNESFVFDSVITSDDFLLEPPHKDIAKLFGENFYEEQMNDAPIIGNNSEELFYKIHNPNRHIDLENAIIVNNDYYFLLWLEVPEDMHNKIYYTISTDTIGFEENDGDYDFSEHEESILSDATAKFERHCINVLDSIQGGIEYLSSNEAIIEDIESNDWMFDIEGNLVNESIQNNKLIMRLNEFEEHVDPYVGIGVGNTTRIKQWMEENYPNVKFNINELGEMNLSWSILTKSHYDEPKLLSELPDYVKINFIKHISERGFDQIYFKDIKKFTDVSNMKRGSYNKLIIELFYLREIYQSNDKLALEDKLIDMLEEFGTDVLDKDIIKIVFGSGGGNNNIILLGKKLFRTELETETDEWFNTYIFIGYTDFKEVTIDGEDFHKKILGIENLLKMDMYNSGDLMNISGMKMRAVTVDTGKVYAVKIPKYLADNDNYYNDGISDKLRKFVDENKYKI